MLINYKQADIYQLGDKPVLRDVNFYVGEGEFVYLIGRVGSGKSSLLKTIYCELDIDAAEEAVVLGTDLMEIKRKQIPALRKQMGIIFQDFQLLSDRTVKGNLKFVLKATGWDDTDDINRRVNEVLADVGMEDKANKYPYELSGGEQQRIAIARAILNKPKLIVADEPTGNLDPETAEHILQLLRRIAEGGTAVIMSTHNIGLIEKYPGAIYRCNDGRLEDITPGNTNNNQQSTEPAEASAMSNDRAPVYKELQFDNEEEI